MEWGEGERVEKKRKEQMNKFDRNNSTEKGRRISTSTSEERCDSKLHPQSLQFPVLLSFQ